MTQGTLSHPAPSFPSSSFPFLPVAVHSTCGYWEPTWYQAECQVPGKWNTGGVLGAGGGGHCPGMGWRRTGMGALVIRVTGRVGRLGRESSHLHERTIWHSHLTHRCHGPRVCPGARYHGEPGREGEVACVHHHRETENRDAAHRTE